MSHLIIKKMFILDIHWNYSFYKIYHRENSDVLIWVENVLKKNDIVKLKMFLFGSTQVELAVLM